MKLSTVVGPGGKSSEILYCNCGDYNDSFEKNRHLDEVLVPSSTLTLDDIAIKPAPINPCLERNQLINGKL